MLFTKIIAYKMIVEIINNKLLIAGGLAGLAHRTHNNAIEFSCGSILRPLSCSICPTMDRSSLIGQFHTFL